MGKVGLYVKILFLVVGLVIVIAVMRSTTKDKVQNAMQALGLEAQPPSENRAEPQAAAKVPSESRRTLCRTRVHAVRFPDGRSVVERRNGLKLDWVAEEVAQTSGNEYGPGAVKDPPSRSLNYIAIEKWFSLHCEYMAGPAPAEVEPLEPSNEPKTYVRFDFIDGTELEFYRSGRVLFSVSDPKDRFVSADLEGALEELRTEAAFPVDSMAR